MKITPQPRIGYSTSKRKMTWIRKEILMLPHRFFSLWWQSDFDLLFILGTEFLLNETVKRIEHSSWLLSIMFLKETFLYLIYHLILNAIVSIDNIQQESSVRLIFSFPNMSTSDCLDKGCRLNQLFSFMLTFI